MENTNPVNPENQERIAAALGALLFFIPILMNKKTDYTVFFMRQNFVLFLASLLGAILTIIPFFGFFVGILNFFIFILIVFLAWKAYSGEKFEIPYIYAQSIEITKNLGIDAWFTPGK